MIKLTQPLQNQVLPAANARMIAANNQRALEMLLRIQSQVLANTVVSVTPRKEINYE